MIGPIAPRKAWATRTVVHSPLPTQPATQVVVHHAVSGVEGSDIDLDNDGLPDSFERILRQIEAFHIDTRGWRGGIAYNACVGHKGSRAYGRGPTIEGGATGSPNDDYSLSLCAIGNYDGVHKVTRQLRRAIVMTIADWVEQGYVVPLPRLSVIGHQEKPYATACPGKGLMKFVPKIKRAVARELQRRRRRRRIQARIKKLRAKIRELQEKL